MRAPSPATSRRCVPSSGSSTPEHRSPDPPRCSPTCPVTPTASPSANSRLIAYDGERVTFRWKDYRASEDNRYKTMSLDTGEFIRRFLIHTLPRALHRIRHYGLFANARRASNLSAARALLDVAAPTEPDEHECDEAQAPLWLRCPSCGAVMRIVETFERTAHRGATRP